MAKFKKGDRVRVKYKDKSKPDYIGTITEVDGDPHDPRPLQIDRYWCLSAEAESIELLTEYTPITPKVGERYRVLKGEHFKVGEIIEVDSKEGHDKYPFWYASSILLNGAINYLTTEYLELVEEESDDKPIKKTIIQKTMNAFKKALLSADTKTLIKAGYMDSETLELTSKGQDALNFIVYEEYQKKLVAAAEAEIAEAEAKKK